MSSVGTATATARTRPTTSASVAVPSGSSDASSRQNNHYHGGYASSSSSSSSSFLTPSLYLSRLMDVSQMDLQCGLDQMRSLLLVPPLHQMTHSNPNQVGKMAYYRWQTKGHWARDDPSLPFLQIVSLLIMGVAYAVAFRNDSIIKSVAYFGIWHSVLFNYLGVGVVMACATKAVADGYLSTTTAATGIVNNTRRQRVEWMYAFDVHCNAFVPFFGLLYVVQFFLLPLVLTKGFFPFLISNVLHSLAFGYYFYITQLGYRALPFLSNTEVFLFPICIVVFIFLLNFIGYPFGFGWNASRIMAHLYFERGQ